MSKSMKYNLVIVSMFKNESWILKEWIDHHLEVGVEHFYLIDNGSTDNYQDILAPYQERGLVTLVVDSRRFNSGKVCTFDIKENCIKKVHFGSTHTQIVLANQYFLETIKKEARWVMYIDQDEYVFSTRTTLKSLLDSIVDDKISHIFMPWRLFGSSHLSKQPTSIRQSFTYRADYKKMRKRAIEHGNIRGFGKSITRVLSLTMLNIHQCEITNYDLLTPDEKLVTSVAEFIKWFETYIPNPETDLLCCNHYITMSEEYYKMCKHKRTSGCGNSARDASYWNLNNQNDVQDTWILSAVKKKV